MYGSVYYVSVGKSGEAFLLSQPRTRQFGKFRIV